MTYTQAEHLRSIMNLLEDLEAGKERAIDPVIADFNKQAAQLGEEQLDEVSLKQILAGGAVAMAALMSTVAQASAADDPAGLISRVNNPAELAGACSGLLLQARNLPGLDANAIRNIDSAQRKYAAVRDKYRATVSPQEEVRITNAMSYASQKAMSLIGGRNFEPVAYPALDCMKIVDNVK